MDTAMTIQAVIDLAGENAFLRQENDRIKELKKRYKLL